MNGLLLSKWALIPADRVLSFSSPRTVMDYFGPDSEEYAAALVYFQAYDNKFTSPRALKVARRLEGDAPGWIKGARLGPRVLAELRAVADGGFGITVGAVDKTIADIDLSACETLSAVGTAVTSALTTATAGAGIVYDSVTGGFVATAASAGAGKDVLIVDDGSGLADLMGLTASAGAELSPGADALGPEAQMAAILESDQNWVGFTTLWEATPLEAETAWASWASANYGWLYVGWTTDKRTLSAGVDDDAASLIKEADLDHSAVVYGSLRHAVFILGSVASIPWARLNGTITLAFKRQSGLEATVSREADAVVLEEKRCNYLGNFATRNADFRFLYPGALSASDYGYIDSYVNSVWLNAKIQRALLDGLVSHHRVPYTDRGYTMIRAWLQGPIGEAVNNGAIEAGVSLNDLQKSELLNEAGTDISDELGNYGYHVQILDPGAEARAKRETPIINLWYTYGGAVQRIEVASNAVL
jgi:hypothetical protein